MKALLSPEALCEWAARMYDLTLSRECAVEFLKLHKRRPILLCEYNLRLSLKWRLMPLAGRKAPFPRPVANPNRINYPLDNYARQTRVTVASLLAIQDEAGPWQKIAIRHMEDSGTMTDGDVEYLQAIARLEAELPQNTRV